MALNTSGPIALAGATAGVSIAVELGLGTTTAISLNQAAVRTLAGVPSGAIIMPTNFYGKSNAPIVTTTGIYYGGETSGGRQNTTTRINVCGALLGSVTNVGTVRDLLGGARIGTNGVFYGGNSTGGIALNTVTRINSSGALVGSQTNVGTARAGVGGALIGSNGVYIGGCGGCTVRKTTIINACGALVGSETTVGTAIVANGGASV